MRPCKMSLTVQVRLLSGRAVTLECDLEEELASLSHRAQAALGVGRGRLLDSSGSVLAGNDLIKDATVRNGDLLTFQVGRVQIQTTGRAFAAVLGDGSVVTWGDADRGGDSSAVQERLKNVQQIQASDYAFAAILHDGSVVSWGSPDCSDDTAVQGQLKNVKQIQATCYAFAAILGDGSVVTWGDAEYGGDSSAVKDQLNSVQHVHATARAFAAIRSDGSVVSWGHEVGGGDSAAVREQLKDVQQIQPLPAFTTVLSLPLSAMDPS